MEMNVKVPSPLVWDLEISLNNLFKSTWDLPSLLTTSLIPQSRQISQHVPRRFGSGDYRLYQPYSDLRFKWEQKCRHGRGFSIGQVSGSDFLLCAPRLSLTLKQSMLEFGWLSRWLNGQQLGSTSRSDGEASLSCTIETNPSIDQITSTKACCTFLPPNLLPSTLRNLAVHLRFSSSS